MRELTEEARLKYNAYQREYQRRYRKANPDKIKAYQRKHWEKKAQESHNAE